MVGADQQVPAQYALCEGTRRARKSTVSGKPRTPAYIAVARQTFDHPIFVQHPHWLPPWLWLIAKAAYKPCAHRLGLGIVDVQRGQLATTLRRLASAWGWPVGNVQYMLRLFQGQGMLTKLTIRTSFHTGIESRKSHRATLLTICNYDKFQAVGRATGQAAKGGFDNELSQVLSHDEEFLPGIIAEVASQQEQPTQKHIDSERVGLQGLQAVKFGDNSSATQWKDKPPHGAKDRKTGKWQIGKSTRLNSSHVSE